MFYFVDHGARWAWIRPPTQTKQEIHVGLELRSCMEKFAKGDVSAPIYLFVIVGPL
jgi:hypothetical protein